MALIFEAFRDYGGPWITILGVLAWIVYQQKNKKEESRASLVEALSTQGLMKTAILLALLCWTWNYGRLYAGDAYLRGAGKVAALPPILFGLILVLAGVAWQGISWRRIRRFQPWATYGLVLVVICCSGQLLINGPAGNLSQGSQERRVIQFIQRRLDYLGCFAAVGKSAWPDGKFEALTTSALISFQMANGLLQNPEADPIGVIRPDCEFRLLARPFPFGPERCLPPGSEEQAREPAVVDHPCR